MPFCRFQLPGLRAQTLIIYNFTVVGVGTGRFWIGMEDMKNPENELLLKMSDSLLKMRNNLLKMHLLKFCDIYCNCIYILLKL